MLESERKTTTEKGRIGESGWLRTRAIMGAVALALALGAGAASAGVGVAPVDVNTASAEALAELPGIGEAKAAAIIAERKRQPFASVDDLTRVSGIGPSTVEDLREHVKTGGKH